MEEIRRILVFILCGLSAVSALTGKGYYCRDPDTGKLHPANSTWRSISFCGNYTCKLRKKPPTGTELLRELNISDIKIATTEARHDDTKNDVQVSASNITPQIVNIVDFPNSVVEKTLFQNDLNNIQDQIKQKIDLDGSDRYLTESEIKTISDLLHNVKKSDLEAIVDIYNLAQDIYKEMDKVTSENIVEETIKRIENFKIDNNQRTSYWYEPINKYPKTEVKPDMELQGTNAVSTTAQPKKDTYFSGPLSNTDFGKLPYYYPLSSFQRKSSYIHPTYNPQFQGQLPPVPSNAKPPCNSNNVVPPNVPNVVNPPLPPPYSYPPQTYQSNPSQYYGGVLKRPFTVESQRLIQPSMLLPYPFSYVQHYNMSTYPFNLYYAENPWTRFDLNNKNAPNPNTQITSNTIEEDKKESSKPKSDLDKMDLLGSLLTSTKLGTKKDWQTDPLPAKVLDEVRAHFEEKTKLLKPFSLRKKIKLEKVGKLVKLDDLHRKRRDTADLISDIKPDSEEYEAFIETITCQSDIDPGFFRMGNISEPYPACCPQRIEADSR